MSENIANPYPTRFTTSELIAECRKLLPAYEEPGNLDSMASLVGEVLRRLETAADRI